MLPFIAHSILDVFTYWWPFPLLKYIILFVIKEEKLSTEKKKKKNFTVLVIGQKKTIPILPH